LRPFPRRGSEDKDGESRGETKPVSTERTILICEDEAALRELVRVSLGAGFGFIEACDGNEALELAKEHRPDVIVLDLMLPGLSGLDVLAELKRDDNGSRPPVVVISAWGDARDEAFAAGADRFVLKPFVPDDLRAVIEELVP
jgi:DNA-binding response OmpR family regulator